MTTSTRDTSSVEAGHRRLEPASRRIRARSAGEWLLDTTDAWLLFEPDRHPTLALPRTSLPTLGTTTATPDDIDGIWVDLGQRWNGRARIWNDPPPDLPDVIGLAVVPLEAADEWFEEDQPLTFMIRDPYRRVDILESTREVSIHVDDTELARSANTRLVLETGMPAHWYLPLAAINTQHIEPSPLRTRCQYKGEAHYWHVRPDHTDLMWAYTDPIPTAASLAGFCTVTPWSPAVRTMVDGSTVEYEDPTPRWASPSMRNLNERSSAGQRTP